MKTVAVLYLVELEDFHTNGMTEEQIVYLAQSKVEFGLIPDVTRILTDKSAGVFDSFNFKKENGEIVSE